MSFQLRVACVARSDPERGVLLHYMRSPDDADQDQGARASCVDSLEDTGSGVAATWGAQGSSRGSPAGTWLPLSSLRLVALHPCH